MAWSEKARQAAKSARMASKGFPAAVVEKDLSMKSKYGPGRVKVFAGAAQNRTGGVKPGFFKITRSAASPKNRSFFFDSSGKQVSVKKARLPSVKF